MTMETRASSAPLAIRSADSRTIGGYAAVFNSPTDIAGIWTEVVAPGAFAAALRNGTDVRALYDHDSGRLLGRVSSGTLRLREDDKGLAVEIDLPDTQDGRDVATLIERGDLKGMSFGFYVTKQEWDETIEPPKRTIREVELFEVTVCGDPAYTDTSIGMRSLEEARTKRRQNNFNAAARRLAMKATVDLRQRGVASKA